MKLFTLPSERFSNIVSEETFVESAFRVEKLKKFFEKEDFDAFFTDFFKNENSTEMNHRLLYRQFINDFRNQRSPLIISCGMIVIVDEKENITLKKSGFMLSSTENHSSIPVYLEEKNRLLFLTSMDLSFYERGRDVYLTPDGDYTSFFTRIRLNEDIAWTYAMDEEEDPEKVKKFNLTPCGDLGIHFYIHKNAFEEKLKELKFDMNIEGVGEW